MKMIVAVVDFLIYRGYGYSDVDMVQSYNIICLNT